MIVTSFFHSPEKFLKKEQNGQNSELDARTYLSFEDALWDLLENKKVPKESTILLPDFYCNDVAQNIQNHAYKIEYYELDDNFLCSFELLEEEVMRIKPSVVVILHVLGILNPIAAQSDKIKTLSANTIVIEDAVHRYNVLSDVQIYSKNHFLIDSRRKVTPFHGSTIYGAKGTLQWPCSNADTNFLLKWYIVFLFWLFQMVLSVGVRFKSMLVIKIADKLIDYHDEFIGDNKKSLSRVIYYDSLWDRVDFEKIFKVKNKHITMYESLKKDLSHRKNIRVITYTEDNKEQLRGFPIAVNASYADEFDRYLLANNIFLFRHLQDNRWSKKRGEVVYFLPAGVQVNELEVSHVISCLGQVAK